MQQQELFDFRRDILFERDNEIACFYDVLSETEDTISYAELHSGVSAFHGLLPASSP